MVLLGSKDTGCEVGDEVGRGVGLVEVNEKLPILLFHNEIATGWVGFVPGGWVPKADEETAVVFAVGIELILLSIECKREMAFHGEFRFFSSDARENVEVRSRNSESLCVRGVFWFNGFSLHPPREGCLFLSAVLFSAQRTS